MREYKLKGTAISNYNDKNNNNRLIEKGEEVIEERARYEELYSKGLITEGTIVEENRSTRKLDDFKLED